MVFLPTVSNSLLVSWAAGWLSFFDPCAFPILIGYLSVLAAPGLKNTPRTAADYPSGWPSLSFFLWFLCGFMVTFLLLAAPVTEAGRWALVYQREIRRFCAVAPVLIGLRLLGMTTSNSADLAKIINTAFFFFMGVGLAAWWSPCPDRTLTTAVIFTGSRDNLAAGFLLLVSYLVGLASPFLLGGLALNTILALFLNIYPRPIRLDLPVGSALILFGVLLFFGLRLG